MFLNFNLSNVTHLLRYCLILNVKVSIYVKQDCANVNMHKTLLYQLNVDACYFKGAILNLKNTVIRTSFEVYCTSELLSYQLSCIRVQHIIS